MTHVFLQCWALGVAIADFVAMTVKSYRSVQGLLPSLVVAAHGMMEHDRFLFCGITDSEVMSECSRVSAAIGGYCPRH